MDPFQISFKQQNYIFEWFGPDVSTILVVPLNERGGSLGNFVFVMILGPIVLKMQSQIEHTSVYVNYLGNGMK